MAINDIAQLLMSSNPLSVDSGPLPVETPFIWGQGGARITPDEIARRRQIADQQVQSDYSPVGHWTQGLGRVLDGLTGGIEQNRLNKAQEQNSAYSQQVLDALLGGTVSDGGATTIAGQPATPQSQGGMLARAMSDPYLDKNVQQLAGTLYERAVPKARAPLEFEQLLSAAGYVPGTPEYQAAANQLLLSRGDPFTTFSLPNGQFFSGRQSMIPNALGATQNMGGANGNPPPPPTAMGSPMEGYPPSAAIAELQKNPGSAQQFDQVFGAGLAAKILGR